MVLVYWAHDNGWWYGAAGSSQGWFPGSYVEVRLIKLLHNVCIFWMHLLPFSYTFAACSGEFRAYLGIRITNTPNCGGERRATFPW